MRSVFSAEQLKEVFSDQDKSALRDFPVLDNLSAGQLFFLAYRNRIHFGRTFCEIDRFALRIDPMNTWKMLHAANLLSGSSGRQGQIYLDLLLILRPSLSLEDFDDIRKSFSKDQFFGSDFFLRKIDLTASEVVVGDPRPFLSAFSGMPGRYDWMLGAEFQENVCRSICLTCQENFPGSIRDVEVVVESFQDPPEGVPMKEFGRKIAKYHAISRLAQEGVKEFSEVS